MRTLVTGAAGFIGSCLAEAIVAQGDEVIGLDCLSDYYDPALKRVNIDRLAEAEAFTFVCGDINDVDLVELLEGVQVVYHLAGQPGVQTSWGASFAVYLAQNVLSTQKLLEAAKEASV
jgi:nucleoside-diphosphate-sugar epimerase